MITSTSNQKIKNVIALKKSSRARREAGVFMVEGIRMFRELDEKLVQEVFMTERVYSKHKAEIDEWLGLYEGSLYGTHAHIETVSEEVYAKISDTVTPQGIMAIVKQYDYSVEDVLGEGDRLVLLLEDIQDPGNLGTMFRTAEAAGVSGIVMSKGTVDVYNPKVIRSTMGALFRVPFIYTEEMNHFISEMRSDDYNVYAAALEGAVPYTKVDYSGRAAILIGNEGNGLKKQTVDISTRSVFIPMAGSVESLNASVSAAVLMYEAARQRGM